MALWDIKGKALGMPVWKLLGGGFHSKIRAYASTLFGKTPDETRERGQRFIDRGFTAVKFGWAPLGQSESLDLALVREARKGVGDKNDLMIDAGLCYDLKTAMQRAQQFEQYRPYWFEEPLLSLIHIFPAIHQVQIRKPVALLLSCSNSHGRRLRRCV